MLDDAISEIDVQDAEHFRNLVRHFP
jgi:hypothetical protein